MVAFISGSFSALGEKYHQRKMRPLRQDLQTSEHPSAIAAAKLPRDAQEDAQLLLGAFSEQSSRVDTFATWTLAVVGGSATLVVSNLDSISAEVSRYYVFLGLLVLGAAALVGLAEKWLALRIQAALASENRMKKDMEARNERRQQDEYEKYDMVDVFDQVIRAFPWWMKGKLVKGLVKALRDPLFSSRSNARLTFWHVGLTGVQVLCFIAFILLMALGVLK